MFQNKEKETMSLGELRKFQLEQLKKTVARVYADVPFYRKRFREKGITPRSIRALEDIAEIPFTYIDDLRRTYPRGLLAVDPSLVVRLHTSSGTTGKPKAVFFTQSDVDNAADLMTRCLVMSGLTKKDVFQNMMSYGLFTGGLMMHYGAERLGCLVIPAAIGNTERQIMLMQDFGTTAVHITPSYLLYLADALEKKHIKPRSLKLTRAYMGAEPHSEETRLKMEEIFGIDVFNSYGLSEMNGPGVAFECPHKNGMHLWEDNFLLEIINPETGASVPDGEEGELVLTTLQREGMPILRYRTHDLTHIMPGKCACGRTHRRIARISGRVDDMFIIKGVNIFPQQIERVLMGIKGVGRNYLIELNVYDKMVVKVELSKEMTVNSVESLSNFKSMIEDKLRAELLVRPKVELHEPGTLPISEGKAKRVIDRRTL